MYITGCLRVRMGFQLNTSSSSFCTYLHVLLSSTANKNSVPTPYSDWTVISPPRSWMILYDIFNPRPIPLVLSCYPSSIYPNALNRVPICSFLIPTPVSVHFIYRYNLSLSSSFSSTLFSSAWQNNLFVISTSNFTLPLVVNLRAFEISVEEIWVKRSGSRRRARRPTRKLEYFRTSEGQAWHFSKMHDSNGGSSNF